ncbi:NAD(P)/FAD-dependent oxidoreductase [Amycolatopsis granulosa]|uniref:NAD(P)/FAD-dependent oxidoreductase n=1 Tax=Amycolatopsis granulosa TaxID=185684 RepID=UPI00142375D8|nr:NAD(P)/FAD-dependent oxidoreductase [Amycolatopsis granulosa]NIH84762.1 thioredoxin reductase (NADPH) [Amycolatopsis granulosa]
METTLWDSVIVGGGAAGLSAGVALARARFATLVVDSGDPRNGPAAHMHGYLTRDGMAPKEFLATGQEEFARYGGFLEHASVVRAHRAADGTFELRLGDDRVLRARSVLVATGLTDELPDIPGLAQRWGRDVHHCPHCHGYEVRDQAIVVIGNAHVAGLLRRQSSSVTLCGAELGDAERQRLTAYGVRVVDARVTRATGDVELDNGETIPCDAIFVAPTPVPRDAILTALGATRDPGTGLVAVDARGATSVPGLWAAGNVVSPRAQVVAAAGAGCTAGIGLCAWLLEHELAGAGH